MSTALQQCVAKMTAAGVSASCIKAFSAHHAAVLSGNTGEIPEDTIEPVSEIQTLEAIAAAASTAPQQQQQQSSSFSAQQLQLLSRTVMLKLNGGLGTGMGLDTAKSLLPVKDGRNFLDFAALHVGAFNKTLAASTAGASHDTTAAAAVRLMLMNSFSTSQDTKRHMDAHYAGTLYPAGAFSSQVELLQNMVPKIDAVTGEPASYPTDTSLEWCPPGHGDVYAALYGSGKLDELLGAGFRYLFISNSDNLGACLDMDILSYFAAKELDFLMEVCQRTDADKKGGHLARAAASGRLLLREAAQCPKSDEDHFQNIQRHKFFNTNNIWVNLERLKAVMALPENDGVLPLPLIRNAKTVNPTDGASAKVFQLETAMGAGIASFERADAIVVPRTRFAPVKTCAELLGLRSDAFVVTPDYRLVLHPDRREVPPLIVLDSAYKFVSHFEELFAVLSPSPAPKDHPSSAAVSLKQCDRLTVKGAVRFVPRADPDPTTPAYVFEGTVEIIGISASNAPATLPPGHYKNTTITL